MNGPFCTARRFAASAPLLFCAFAAVAAAASLPSYQSAWASGKWSLSSGTSGSGKVISSHDSAEACHVAGDALAKAAKKAPTYACKAVDVGTYKVVVATVPAPTAPTPLPVFTWSKLADENGGFTVDAPQQIRYGAGVAWAELPIDKGSYTCGNALFGDPVRDVVKTCELRSGGPIVMPPQIVWQPSVKEGEVFFNADRQFVRYGVDNRWTQRVVQGAGACVATFFNNDPAMYTLKHCEINTNLAVPLPADPVVATPTPPPGPQPFPSMHGGIAVSPDRLLPPNTFTSYSTDRINPTDEIAPDSDIGAFRTTCDYSHMAFDDPIVYPGQFGKSHLHVFFGNAGANAASTYDSLMKTGDSTCRGGTANRSAYWIPALIDTTTGAPQQALAISVYYKTGYDGVQGPDVHPMPEGLRMIAGNPTAMTWDDAQGSWSCDKIGGGDTNGQRDLPDNCVPGGGIQMHVNFPQCWDGVNLDSPNHKDHMAYPSVYIPGCPKDHPVALPAISYIVYYQLPFDHPERIRKDWRLASDMYSTDLPGGYSVHGDWFGAWKRDVMEAFTKGCMNARKDCHSHLLGDGRAIY